VRIVSFLPSATEMLYALGLGEQLVGITHECDYPPEVLGKPVVVRSSMDPKGLSPLQIDEIVSRTLRAGQSLYVADEQLLKNLQPDLIITQDLCQVCAPSGNEIGRVVKYLPKTPKILWLTPTCLSDIFENLLQVGESTHKVTESKSLVDRLKKRIEAVSNLTQYLKNRPRVFCFEWLAPVYNSGHWMPELIELAGGVDRLARKGQDSTRISWKQIVEYGPEFLFLSPCGFKLEEVLGQASLFTQFPGWQELRAVREDKVYCFDANSYFARPGPRVVEGVELLASVLHPEKFSWSGPSDAYRKLTMNDLLTLSKNRVKIH